MLKKASPKTGSSPPNLDDVRRQSRHRLIGASLLVVVAVVGFPMVFDTQPRPISVDLPILIPAQPAVSPLTPVAAAPTASDAPPADATPAPAPAPAVVVPVKPVAQPAEKPAEKAADKPSAKPPAQAAAPVAEAQTPTKPDASGERFVVQVGASCSKNPVEERFRQLSRHSFRMAAFSVFSVFLNDGVSLIDALVNQFFELVRVHAVEVQDVQAFTLIESQEDVHVFV
jgi:hypothetical protein